MGDDIGIWNIGAYHRGLMAGKTPHLDKLAAAGRMVAVLAHDVRSEEEVLAWRRRARHPGPALTIG